MAAPESPRAPRAPTPRNVRRERGEDNVDVKRAPMFDGRNREAKNRENIYVNPKSKYQKMNELVTSFYTVSH